MRPSGCSLLNYQFPVAEGTRSLKMVENSWLKRIMFSASSRAARQTACSNIESVVTNFEKKKEVIDLLTRYGRKSLKKIFR